MNAALGMYPYILYSTRDVMLTCRCTADASGDRDAKMHWTVTDFRDFIFMPHRLKLVGWPPEYIFRNPSKMRTHEMRTLLCLLNTNRLYFTRASDEEVADARLNARAAAPGPLFPAPPLNYGRRDIGRRLPRYDEHGQLKKTRYQRNGPKSAKSIEDTGVEEGAGQSAAHRELSEDPISEFEN